MKFLVKTLSGGRIVVIELRATPPAIAIGIIFLCKFYRLTLDSNQEPFEVVWGTYMPLCFRLS